MKPKLILHIGAGKTGSSSIQQTLDANPQALADQGLLYLGVMLEHAPVKQAAWQSRSAIAELRAEPTRDRRVAIVRILRACARQLEASGIDTLVWSNEAFFDSPDLVLPAMRVLREDFDVTVLAYVRRHDKWVKSAYAQWGIKHKMYDGPLLPFKDWIKQTGFDFYGERKYRAEDATEPQLAQTGTPDKGTRAMYFAPRLAPWVETDPQWLVLRNFDTRGDVVADFLGFLGASPNGIKMVRANESPAPSVLALWALHNAQSNNKVKAQEFQTVLQRADLLGSQELNASALKDLLPNSTELEVFAREMTQDRLKVNDLLVNAGESPLDTGAVSTGSVEVSELQLVAGLVRIAGKQQREIIELRSEVLKLRRMAKRAAGRKGIDEGDPVTGAGVF
jgi:hypothetical protein